MAEGRFANDGARQHFIPSDLEASRHLVADVARLLARIRRSGPGSWKTAHNQTRNRGDGGALADAPRWVEVTPSPFPHEAEGLAIVRKVLPQTSPYRAWSNVEFRDGQGNWHEVDLIVLGQRRLHLVELKYYSGTLRGDDLRWLRDGHRVEDSPLKLARRKAQRLASKLRDELLRWAQETGAKIGDVRDVVPFVQESVFLHHPGMRCVLPPASQVDLFGLDGGEHSSGLPGISSRLLEPPTANHAIGGNREAILTELMGRIGLVQRRQREVGSWMIDDEPLGEGEGWQDWPASHRLVATDRARIRVRVTPPSAAAHDVARVRKVVEHEYRIMSRLAHDGVLRPRDLVDDELGVGLVYPYDDSYERLDLWQADRPQGVPLVDQLSLLRQVAEAGGYAHRHRVVHRGLNPLAVSVKELPGHGLRVLVGDWQSAGLATGEALTGVSATGVTSLAAAEATDRLGAVLGSRRCRSTAGRGLPGPRRRVERRCRPSSARRVRTGSARVLRPRAFTYRRRLDKLTARPCSSRSR